MKTTERSEAQRLFFQTNYTKSKIAEMLGVSRRTLSVWAHHGNWDKLRKSSRTLPAIVAEKCYHLVDEYTSGLLADSYAAQNINYRHAQTIHLLATSIKKLKNGSTVNEAMQTFNLFLGGLEHRHPELAAQVAPEVDEFIRLTAGSKTTDHLTSHFADDGTVPFNQEDFTEKYKDEAEAETLNEAFEEFIQHRDTTTTDTSSPISTPPNAHSTSPSPACGEPVEPGKDGEGLTTEPEFILNLSKDRPAPNNEDDPEGYSQPDNVYPPGPAPACTPSHTVVANEDEVTNLNSKAAIHSTLQTIIKENNFTKNQNQSTMQTTTEGAHTLSPHTARPIATRTVSPLLAEGLFPLPDHIIIIRNALAHSDLPLERKQEIMSRALAKEGDNYIYREKGRRIATALEENGFAPYLGPTPMPPADLARFNEMCRNVSLQFEEDVRLYKSWLEAAGLKYPPMILNAEDLTELDPYHKSDGPMADWDELFPDDEDDEYDTEIEIEEQIKKPVTEQV
jgi:hypothetical protein